MSVPRNYNDHSDDVLSAVEEFRRGNPEAFQFLYRHFANGVYRFCLRMTGDEANAKDAYQETFMRVYEHRFDFRGENFPAWLFTIARRVCLNHLRSRKSFDEFDEILHTEETLQESDSLLQMHIKRALDGLPPEFREVVLLREYEGLSYQEIADACGIDLSLAKVRVHRARLLLRKILLPIVQEQS